MTDINKNINGFMGKAVTKVKAGNFYAMEYVSNNGVAKSMIRIYRFRLTGVPPN